MKYEVNVVSIFKSGKIEEKSLGFFDNKKAAKLVIGTEISGIRELYKNISVNSSKDVTCVIIHPSSVINFIIYPLS